MANSVRYHPRATTDQPVFPPVILSSSRAEISYDPLPRAILAHCIEFVGNALLTGSVNKHFLYSSYDACQSIAKASKGILSWAVIINPQNSNVYEYSNLIKTIHSTYIDQVHAIGIKVDRRQEAFLQTLIQRISARNFNLFFTEMLKLRQTLRLRLTSEEQDQVMAQQKLWSAERDDLEKAKQGRIWMQENQAILQKIDSLDLIQLGLSPLPPEIGLLTQLKELCLSQNRLKSLPREIGSLTKLERLELDKNQLNSLPREIGFLRKLKQLHLHYNQLKSLPPEIGSLTKLEQLYLNNNQLESLPREIGSLTKLEQLRLNDNQFKSLLREIGCLTNLKQLYLWFNQLNSLPREIGSLTKLEQLHLSCTQLNSLPGEIGSLTKLEALYLNHNQLKSLPQEIGSLTKLKQLYLT